MVAIALNREARYAAYYCGHFGVDGSSRPQLIPERRERVYSQSAYSSSTWRWNCFNDASERKLKRTLKERFNNDSASSDASPKFLTIQRLEAAYSPIKAVFCWFRWVSRYDSPKLIELNFCSQRKPKKSPPNMYLRVLRWLTVNNRNRFFISW